MAIQAGKAMVLFKVLQEMGILFSAMDDQEREAAAAAPGSGAGQAGEPARHVFSSHRPLWAYEDPFFARPVPDEPPVFEILPPETDLCQALAKTRFVVLVGAALTPEFQRLLAEPGVIVLVFESDPARLDRFLLQVSPAQLANKAFLFLGQPDRFLPPLSAILPESSFSLGFPVFFILSGADQALAAHARRVAEHVEVLFFRHRIYPLSGQSLNRSIPLRPIAQGLFYDQQVHAYENLAAFADCPDIGVLRGLFRGETAVLVAAGIDLASKVEFLREQQDKALIIAVNSALKPLVEAGIRPHFCVVNDTSLPVANTFAGLPLLRSVMLVAHCLSCLGGEVFAKRFLFGNCWPEIFGTRPNLRLHGSVITTAVSLAHHLGCREAVLVGAQLSSDDPWSLRYAGGGTGVAPVTEEEKRKRLPFLVPVQTPFGETRYASLNFLDVKYWLMDELRLAGMHCTNTTKDSILFGEGVDHEERPAIAPTGRLAQCLRQAFAATRPAPRAERPVRRVALALAGAEKARWAQCLHLTERVLAMPGRADYEAVLAADRLEVGSRTSEFFDACWSVLKVFDANNISYLVQRFEDFSQPTFHASIHSPFYFDRFHGFLHYYTRVRSMLRSLLAVLEAQETVLKGSG